MSLIVWGIVGCVNDQNSSVNLRVYVDDWTAESAVKASYASPLHWHIFPAYPASHIHWDPFAVGEPTHCPFSKHGLYWKHWFTSRNGNKSHCHCSI